GLLENPVTSRVLPGDRPPCALHSITFLFTVFSSQPLGLPDRITFDGNVALNAITTGAGLPDSLSDTCSARPPGAPARVKPHEHESTLPSAGAADRKKRREAKTAPARVLTLRGLPHRGPAGQVAGARR